MQELLHAYTFAADFDMDGRDELIAVPWVGFNESDEPPRAEICRANGTELPKRPAQYGTRVQWALPVTGSSGIPALGAKNRETKSQ